MPAIDASFQMWAVYAVILIALAFYATERLSLELTSLGVIVLLLVFFHLAPVAGDGGANRLDAERLLAGFANPALIAVASLLVMGQGLARTGVIERAMRGVSRMSGRKALIAVPAILALTLVMSAFLNNTPVVVILIPLMQAIAERSGKSASSVMIPLSYVAILGGMTTLIGSSTNILVSGSLQTLGFRSLTVFEITAFGLILAAVGFVYVYLVAPRLLKDRASLATALAPEASGRHFIAQLVVGEGSKLVDATALGGMFPSLKDVTVRMIQRRERAIVPPFEEFALQPGDMLVVAATRSALTDAVSSDPGLHYAGGSDEASETPSGRPGPPGQMLAEVMVTPASRLIGQNLEQIGFRYQFGAVVLGIQRRSRMIRARMTEIRLEAGDVLLIQGPQDSLLGLRGNPDILPMEWSATDLPSPYHARQAVAIFAAVVVLAGTGLLPIAIAALAGAGAMVATGCLNIRQASRAIDRRIVLLIAASLAMGAALQETGGAAALAQGVLGIFEGMGAAVVLSAFFLIVAILTNLLSNNACAVLFTPIGVSIATGLGIDPTVFALAVLFAANCSFASPIGYQTNLLVMGPGHYRFVDFIRAGLPLVLLLWLVFSLVAPWYFGL